MDWKKESLGFGAELNDDDLDGVSGGTVCPMPQEPPTQPMPSRPSIPRDPGLPGATPTPTPTPVPTTSPKRP